MTVFIDGNGPGCKCGPACEFPCWQRVGLTDQKCCAGCAELPKEENVMDQMERDNARDRRVKRLFDTARRALDAILADEDARYRLGEDGETSARLLIRGLEDGSAHVVRVWD